MQFAEEEDHAVRLLYSLRTQGWWEEWIAVGGPLRRELTQLGFQHPDDMWEALLRAFWQRLHGHRLDLSGFANEATRIRNASRVLPHWVVLPAETAGGLAPQCSRRAPSPDSTWTPDPNTIAQLEAVLPAALNQALLRRKPTPPERFKTTDYYRQYGGFVVGGSKIIYINGFHRDSLDMFQDFPTQALFWRTIPAGACDGGAFFFGAEYDPATRRLSAITFNSN
jgi:hypothetical protein